MTLLVVPARTRTPQDVPAGTGTCCRRTEYPRSRSRSSTSAAARRYAADVASRGPIRSERVATKARAAPASNATGAADGVGRSGAADAVGDREGAGLAGAAPARDGVA